MVSRPARPGRLEEMSELRIRPAARAVMLDPDGSILLVRFEFPGRTIWATPGGGIEPGESAAEALRRELAEETGLEAPEIGPLIWTRLHIIPFIGGAWDGQREQYHLVRTAAFTPRPRLSWEQLERRVRVRAPLVDARRARAGAERRPSLPARCPSSSAPSSRTARRASRSTPASDSCSQPCRRLAIGSRQSRPKARGRSLTPGGACRRLYSARSTSASTLSTVAGSNSASSSSRERSSSTYASSTGSSRS